MPTTRKEQLNMGGFDEANEFMDNLGGAPTLKFDNVGDMHKGKLVKANTSQETDFKTKEPLFKKDGTPYMQLVLTIEDDRGDEGSIYLKRQGLYAYREAMQKAGVERMSEGDIVAIRFDHEEASSVAGGNPQKIFVCEYKKVGPSDVSNVDMESMI